MAPPARNSRNIFMELRKICQHPYLVAPELENETLSDNEKHRLLVQGCGKMAFLKILLPKLKERGRRVLLFSQFKIALDWIQDFLTGEGYSFLRLDGDLQQAKRQKSIDAFNAPGSEHFIFLLTTRAGGVGINLATADTVIVYDPDFNPHQDLQATARSHRYGQTKKVLVFKLMTKDSVEERIVQQGKKKMVLDHLVVQNLGKDNEEEDVNSMLLAGAKALYETNADGTSASDISYTPKQVEEMLDKVEKQAEEEAVLYKQKWDKDDAMTEDEKLASLNNKGPETMNFAFAKIWEMDKGELGEVEADPEVDDEMEENWMTVFENAERERVRKEAEEAQNKKERRKRIDYGFDDSPRKKNGKSKSTKSKQHSRETSTIGQYQSSDSEFHIGTAEVSADDSSEMEVIPEGMSDLGMGPVPPTAHSGTFGRKKTELTKMERRALRKKLEEEMLRKAAIIQIQAATDPKEAGPSTAPAQTNEEAFFAGLASRKGNLNRDEKKALRQYLNAKVKVAQPTQPRKSKSASPTERNGSGSGPILPTQTTEDTAMAELANRSGTLSEADQQTFLKYLNNKVEAVQSRNKSTSTSPTIQNEAGPSTRVPWPNMTGHIMTTNGEYTEVQKQKQKPTGPKAEALAAWAQNALKKKADLAGRAELRKALERSMQEARHTSEQAKKMLDRQTPPVSSSGQDTFQENLVRIQRLAELEAEKIVNAMTASRTGVPIMPTVPAPSASVPNLSIRPSTPNDIIHPAPNGSTSQHAPLVQHARSSSKQDDIAKAQEIISWLWHHLTEFGLRKELNLWARMTLPEVPPHDRRAIYSNLAKVVDHLLKNTGHPAFYTDPRLRPCLEALFDEKVSGTGQSAGPPKMPIGIGRLIGPPLKSNGQATTTNMRGPSRPTNLNGNGNGQASVPHVPQLDASSIARPAAQLITPQQAAAMARSAVLSAPPQVVTQPRRSNLISSSNNANGSTTRTTDLQCPFCRKFDHYITTCPARQQKPLGALLRDLAQAKECVRSLPPGSNEAARAAAMVREITRLIGVQEAFNALQTQQGFPQAGSSSVPSDPSLSVNTTSNNGPPVSETPLPPRFRQRVSGSEVGNGIGQGTAGNTVDDAINIDDDDDDATIAVPTAAMPPASAPLMDHVPRPVSTAPWDAPPPPAYPPPYANLPTPSNAPVSGQNDECPMCRKRCNLDLKTCAENNGGRKVLKDRIRKLNADGSGGGDAITALYEVYQAWPREETPKRKKVKREHV